MNTTTMSALLGRPLTSVETANFDLYLKIARESLDDLLCMDLCSQDDPRVYDARAGYRTVFTDIFTEVTEVQVNGDVIAADKYSVRQWDNRGEYLKWYNSIVFDDPLYKGDEVTVSAYWGFSGKMPKDLQNVLAGLFDLITKKHKFDGTITNKKVEDFSVSFDTSGDLDEKFFVQNNRTINKYSLCSVSSVTHGEVPYYDC